MMLRKAANAHEHGLHLTVKLSSPPIAHVTNLHELVHTACRLQGTLATHQQLQDHILKPLWELGIYDAGFLPGRATDSILAISTFNRKFPAAGLHQKKAVNLLTSLLCCPGLNLAEAAMAATARPVQAQNRKRSPCLSTQEVHHHNLPHPGRIDTVLDCRQRNGLLEYQVQWQLSMAIKHSDVQALLAIGLRAHVNMPSASRMAPKDTRSVAWKPSWVSAEYMSLHWAGKLAAFQANYGSAAQSRETVQAALTSQGQDCNLSIPAYCTGYPPNITLCTDEVHPEVDATPTGHIELRRQADHLIICHDAQGKCIETITETSLAGLCSHLWRHGHDCPEDVQGPKQAVAQLLRAQGGRYVQHDKRDKASVATHHDRELLAAIQDCFSTSVQWLQGPLHCLSHVQCPQRADSDISASYAYKWVGSGQAHPCLTPQQTAEGLRWALASTLTDTAALTAMLLPDALMAGFRRLLRHPHAHCLCHLPSGTVPSGHSASWTGRAPAVSPVQHPMQLVVVANTLGLENFCTEARLASLRTYLVSKGVPDTPWPSLSILLQATCQTGGSRPLEPEQIRTAAVLTTPALNSVQALSATLLGAPVTTGHPQPLMANQHHIYTDGSKKDQSVTAACYCPGPHGGGEATRWAARCTGHPAHLNTALRGELAALHYAVHHMATQDHDVVVFTDSLTAIQLVSRMLYRPNSLRHHMHRGILQEILPRILARKGHTTICKVRAHIGIPGNAQADSLCRAAHAAAPGPDFVAATGSTAGPNWVLVEHHTPTGATELRQVTNLRRGLQSVALEAHVTKLQDNPDTKYAALNRAVRTTHGGLLPKASNYFWHIPALSDNKKQLMMKVRQGLVVTLSRKRHLDADPEGSRMCLLCPTQQVRDTQGHRLGGCKHPLIHGQVTARHGKAVHLLTQAARAGHIGNCCMFTDAEGYEMYPAQSKTTGKRCLPRWVLPFSKQTSKPDLVVFPGTRQADVDNKRACKIAFRRQQTIHLIEVGYTGDYGLHDRVAHKLTQHSELQAKLLDHSWKEVHMHAFVIGHTGMQPQSNMAVLQALQLNDANSLLATVHMHSVDTCYSLLRSYEQEVKRIQASAGLQGDVGPEDHPSLGTPQHLHRSGPAFGSRPKMVKHHRHSRPTRDIQTNTQGIRWPQQPLPAAHPPMEASLALHPNIRLEWHPG